MKHSVKLFGELADRFGSSVDMNVKRPIEIFQCLEANDPSLKQYLVNCVENDTGFNIKVAGKELEKEEDLLLSLNEGDYIITPMVAGSKGGGGKILMAAAIIGFMFFMPAGAAGANLLTAKLSGWAAAAQTMAIGVAVNLALTGIQQMLAPDPGTEENEESYLFNGSEQNIVEGDPVPVLYGQLRVPGRPISFEVINRKFTNSSNTGVGSYDFVNAGGPSWGGGSFANLV